MFILLLYMVGFVIQLVEHYDFFQLRWAILGVLPPYVNVKVHDL